MVTTAHSGQYGVDYTPTELSVVGIYPNAMPWAEALGNHAFKPRILFKHIQLYTLIMSFRSSPVFSIIIFAIT